MDKKRVYFRFFIEKHELTNNCYGILHSDHLSFIYARTHDQILFLFHDLMFKTPCFIWYTSDWTKRPLHKQDNLLVWNISIVKVYVFFISARKFRNTSARKVLKLREIGNSKLSGAQYINFIRYERISLQSDIIRHPNYKFIEFFALNCAIFILFFVFRRFHLINFFITSAKILSITTKFA